jgi:hypothetical protein
MPRCVRNFWLDADIDGRRSRFASGPRTRDGGFRLDIYTRERGAIGPSPVRVSGRCCAGTLSLTVEDDNRVVFEKAIER